MFEGEEPRPLDTSALDEAIWHETMQALMSTPQELADRADYIMHALDDLSGIAMPTASAEAVADVIAMPPSVVLNYAAVENGEPAPSSMARADHARFLRALSRLRDAKMPPELTAEERGSFHGIDLGGMGDAKDHVAVLMRASASAWSEWASVIEILQRGDS